MTAANQIAQTIISDSYFLKLYRVCVERSVLRTLNIDTEEKYTEKEILESKLSPYVIRGNEKLVNNFKCAVCAKTLYNYIGKGLLKVKNIDLLLRVRRKTKGGM